MHLSWQAITALCVSLTMSVIGVASLILEKRREKNAPRVSRIPDNSQAKNFPASL